MMPCSTGKWWIRNICGIINYHRKCLNCGLVFQDDEIAYRLHVAECYSGCFSYENKTYFCSFCNYTTMKMSNIKHHVLTHTSEKPYACIICPYRANQKSHLESHMLKHSGAKPFKCNYCDFKAARKQSLKYHLNTKHFKNFTN